ncbi:MAG: hypothetical protein ACOYD0_12940 [Candidatus Nanopelagicales bacterium]
MKAPIRVGKTADFGNGAAAVVSKVTAVTVKAQGLGEISGPGMKLELTMINGTGKPVNLDGVVPTVSYGPKQAPASPVLSQTARLAGELAPGQSATGTYVFTVGARGVAYQVRVSYTVDQPIVVFTGRL